MVRLSCLAFAIIATFAVGVGAVGWEFKAPGTWQAKQKKEAEVRGAAARRRRAVQAAAAAPAAAGADEDDCARTKRNLRAEVRALKRKVDLLAHEAASLRKRAAAAEAAAAGAFGAADIAPGAATHFDPSSGTGRAELGLAQAATADYALGKDEPFAPPTSSSPDSPSSPSCDSPPALLDVSGPAVEVPLSASDMDLPPLDAGNTARLERLVSKLRSGAPVSIVVFGGSVSAGHGCSFNMTYDGADRSDGAVYRPPYCADAGMAVVTAEIAGNKNWADADGNKGAKVCLCTWSGALLTRSAFPFFYLLTTPPPPPLPPPPLLVSHSLFYLEGVPVHVERRAAAVAQARLPAQPLRGEPARHRCARHRPPAHDAAVALGRARGRGPGGARVLAEQRRFRVHGGCAR